MLRWNADGQDDVIDKVFLNIQPVMIFFHDSFAGTNSIFLLSSILLCQIFPSCSGLI